MLPKMIWNDNLFHTPGIRGRVTNCYLANNVWLKVPAKGVFIFVVTGYCHQLSPILRILHLTYQVVNLLQLVQFSRPLNRSFFYLVISRNPALIIQLWDHYH